jgi:hypothetical protein
LSDEEVDAAAGAAVGVAGVDEEVLSLLVFESLLGFESLLDFESVVLSLAVLPSPEDLGFALP